MGRGGGIPERWLDYKAVGEKIEGLPIRACKVPLKQAILSYNLAREKWFTPDMLVESVPDLGCVVDLTATSRYYDPKEFTRRGIRHVKIFCEGHVIPSRETVERFFEAMNEFLGHPISKDKVLLVHCTHGLNRTGYLVARYMVEQRGFEPQDAIRAFNAARGHDIERANYLADLETRKATYVPIAPTPDSIFCIEKEVEAEWTAQTARDRDRRPDRPERSHGRSWSRDSRTSTSNRSSTNYRDARDSGSSPSNRRDDKDRHSSRNERNASPERSSRHQRKSAKHHEERQSDSPRLATHIKFERHSSPEPGPPGCSAVPVDTSAVNAANPPKWKIPKKKPS